MDDRRYSDRNRGYGASRPSPRNKNHGQKPFLQRFAEAMTAIKGAPDYFFLGVIVLLIAYGIIMLFSASSARAYAMYGNALHFVVRQGISILLGALGMLVTSKLDYHIYGGKIAGMMYVGAIVALILVLIPGLGTTVNGATRWLFGIQPSELAKIAIIILFAYDLGSEKGQKELKNFQTGILKYIIRFAIYAVLLLLEPHMSCTILIGATIAIMLLCAGVPWKHVGVCAVPVALLAILMIVIEPYRMLRITSFLDPFADMQGSGFQIVQSLYAIGSGGIFGVGLGQSRQKYQSLPEPQNDFIFSVLSEELGLIGATLLIALFIILLVRGVKIALNAPDLFGTLLVIGIVGIVCLQAVINIAVVTASIPVTGMPLPFFSYGGTAIAITMAEMGIVLNVSRQAKLG